MAIYRPGPIVGGVSGTIGALNFTSSSRSLVIRRALRRTDKQTVRQLRQRNDLRAVHRAWRGLTPEMRESWITAAAKITRRNKLGTPRHPSGHQLYIESNCIKLSEQGAGAVYLYPPAPVLTPPPYDVTLTITLPDTYTLSWLTAADPMSTYHRCMSARPLTSRPYYRSWRWRWTDRWTPGSPWDLKDAIIAQWGVPRVTELVAVRLQILDVYLLPSIWVVATCIVS